MRDRKFPVNIDRTTIEKVYDVLIADCGASTTFNAEYHFISYVTGYDYDHVEYIFEGMMGEDNLLGRGGKFRINPSGWCVSCYPEDSNEERLAIIQKVNPQLAALRAEYLATRKNSDTTTN